MTEGNGESQNCNEEPEAPACPHCGESRVDFLEWQDDVTVRCLSCGGTYQPDARSEA
jgi:uncharacterized Zn finger protein